MRQSFLSLEALQQIRPEVHTAMDNAAVTAQLRLAPGQSVGWRRRAEQCVP
jgi:hypothetical protein